MTGDLTYSTLFPIPGPLSPVLRSSLIATELRALSDWAGGSPLAGGGCNNPSDLQTEMSC